LNVPLKLALLSNVTELDARKSALLIGEEVEHPLHMDTCCTAFPANCVMCDPDVWKRRRDPAGR